MKDHVKSEAQVAVIKRNTIEKKWEEKILVDGGSAYWKSKDNKKEYYKVAMTFPRKHSHKYKFKVMIANGEIFSVNARTILEAQKVVDEIFGKGKYRVSQMLC